MNEREINAATKAVLANPPHKPRSTAKTRSISEGWRQQLKVTSHGQPVRSVANAILALSTAPEWRGVLAYDESALRTVARAAPPWDPGAAVPFEWTDNADVLTAAWLQDQDILVQKETTGQAVEAVARRNPFHPIREYLNSLQWDGLKRIDDWLTLYLGADPSGYTRAVASKWLIGAVARIFKPGCKNDTCMILEGPQGALKSTALRTLAHPWFTDDIAELGSKDAAMQLAGAWIIEIAELDSMSKAEVSRVKAFMSRQEDRFRPTYGRRVIAAKRQCLLVGTVNLNTYLRDETGGRRWWPVRCGAIKIEELRRDRDQLWAEARERYRAGETWWLQERAVISAAAEEQAGRYEGDAWDEAIGNWIEGRESVSVAEVMEHCIDKKLKDVGQQDQNRVARALRSKGWERYRQREGKRLEWRYRMAPGAFPVFPVPQESGNSASD